MARIKLISLCFIFLHLANSCCGTELNIDSKIRPEQLSLDDFANITNALDN